MYIDLGEGDLITESQPALSVCGWVNKSSDDGNRALLMRHSNVVNLHAGANLSAKFRVYNNIGSYVEVGSNNIPSKNEWHHYCGVYNGAEVSLYVDGVLQDDVKELTGDTATNTNNIYLGFDPTYSAKLLGLIDHTIIYNFALSSAEIKADYNSGNNSLLSFDGEQIGGSLEAVRIKSNFKIKGIFRILF